MSRPMRSRPATERDAHKTWDKARTTLNQLREVGERTGSASLLRQVDAGWARVAAGIESAMSNVDSTKP